MKSPMKKRLGAILFDIPRYLSHILINTKGELPNWVKVRNRGDKLALSPKYCGVKCEWRWTSDLYLPKLFPYFGISLFNKAFSSYPITLSEIENSSAGQAPEVSFIIGHRGLERIPLLLKTLESIGGQRDCEVECIVVEQDNQQLIKKLLPSWVKYVFTPLQNPKLPYSRAWAFNEGARHARSDCFIFHDNDLVIPDCYAREVVTKHRLGFEFVNLKRFIFYLTKNSTASFIENGTSFKNLELETIMQNSEGGGSIGVTKKGFEDIGKFDQRFIGWGGEDNEFWERAQTKNTWVYTFLPLIHLWHTEQPEKGKLKSPSSKSLYDELSTVSPVDRIKRLRAASPNVEH